VLAKVFSIKRVTWTFLSEHAQVLDYDGRRLLLGISTIGLANTFRKGQHAELVRQALIEVLGVDAVVEGIPTPEAGGAAPASSPSAPASQSDAPAPATEAHPDQDRPAGRSPSPDREGLRVMAAAAPAPDDLGPEPDDDWNSPSAPPPEWATEASRAPAQTGRAAMGAAPGAGPARAGRAPRSVDDPAATPRPAEVHPRGTDQHAAGQAQQHPAPQAQAQAQEPAPAPAPPEQEPVPTRTPSPMERARQAVAREAGARRAASPVAADDSSVSADDEDIEDAGAMGVPVIERVLGGTVMGELEQ
jgi:DNA polymerase-3 subunit gamma/tau